MVNGKLQMVRNAWCRAMNDVPVSRAAVTCDIFDTTLDSSRSPVIDGASD